MKPRFTILTNHWLRSILLAGVVVLATLASGQAVRSATEPCNLIGCQANQTCTAQGTSTYCANDPAPTGDHTQCNQSSCYKNGEFLNPAPANCYQSWPACSANTVIKVKKDRQCDVWMTCDSSITSIPAGGGAAENLCMSLSACNKLNDAGHCARYLPTGQCSNNPMRFCDPTKGELNNPDCLADGATAVKCLSAASNTTAVVYPAPITYQSPADITKLANLSGNVVAGINWGYRCSNDQTIICENASDCPVGTDVKCEPTKIDGQIPWQLMRQLGSSAKLMNGDFESDPPSISPWQKYYPNGTGDPSADLTVELEDPGSSNTNHVLKIDAGLPDNVALSNTFSPDADSQYYITARLRGGSGTPHVTLTFAAQGDPVGLAAASVELSGAWQKVVFGPFTTSSSGLYQVLVKCSDNGTPCQTFYLDDVQIKPLLQTRSDTNLDLLQQYSIPSCRLYPKSDAPACDYITSDGLRYRGWHGYCLETDSTTNTCLSWWPVDLIKGEVNPFSAERTVGYDDRQPLYFCAESEGVVNRPDPASGSTTMTRDMVNQDWAGKTFGHYQIMSTHIWGYQGSNTGCGASGYDFNNPRGVAFCDNRNKNNGIGSAVMIPNQFFEASAEDKKIHDYDIEFAAIIPQTMGDYGPGTHWLNSTLNQVHRVNASTSQPGNSGLSGPWLWSYVNDSDSGNWVTIQFIWDEIDHHLRGYKVAASENSDRSQLWLQVFFYQRERCDKIVQVVSATGDNLAWTARLASGQYVSPDLGYINKTDMPPFGSILQPAGYGNDPVGWPIPVFAEKYKADFEYPGQARSGSPFACKGQCNNGTASQCVSTCTAGVNAGKSCTSDTQCPTVASTNGFCADQDYAANDCVRLAPGAEDPSDCLAPYPAGRAVAANTCFLGPRDGQSCNFDSDCAAATTKPTYESCGSAGTCSISENSCSRDHINPNQDCAVAENKFVCSTDETNNCSTDAKIKQCQNTTAVTENQTVVGTCVGVDSSNANLRGTQSIVEVPDQTPTNAHYAEYRLSRLFAQSYGLWEWLPDNNNPNAYSYQQVTNGTTTWLPPTLQCPESGRPDFATGTDYCAIPPAVTNASFANAPGNVATLSGDGSMTIKFNTQADPNQAPLQTISINWGDGSDIDTISYPFAPKTDGTNPHQFSHLYHKGQCIGQLSCEIRVRVRDNWNWCNDGSTNNPCPAAWDDQTFTGLSVFVQ